MKNKIKYTNEPMGQLKVIKDFLPSPDKLVLKEENVKVTIALNKSSIEFFKREAQRYHTSYQKMIRRLIDLYASQHKRLPNKKSSGLTKHRDTLTKTKHG